MKTKYIIIGLIIILVVLYFIQNKEHAGSTPGTPNLSSEAVQNIAKIYADTNNTAVFNNITSLGTITGNVKGNVTGNVAGNVTGNVQGNLSGNVNGGALISGNGQYFLYMQDNGNLAVVDKNGKSVWYSFNTIVKDKPYVLQSETGHDMLMGPRTAVDTPNEWAYVLGNKTDVYTHGKDSKFRFYIKAHPESTYNP